MGLSTKRATGDYARLYMPAVKRGDGPWGEAIQYWLPRRNMRQADLARAAGIEEKTMSSMARGFDTTTKKLRAVAEALEVPLDQVMVSPERQRGNQDLTNTVTDAVVKAVRDLEHRRAITMTDEDAETERKAGIDKVKSNVRAAEIRAALQKGKRKSLKKKR